MIKRIISSTAPPPPGADPEWLALDELAEVEITSESPAHPIEQALNDDPAAEWRAAGAGEQLVRLRFSSPRPLKQVRVVIEEHERERTQQFVLRAATSPTGPWREIARQQFNFSPGGATREQEDFRPELPAVSVLELSIVPDIGGSDAIASLQQLRVA